MICPSDWELDLFHSEDLASADVEAVREHLAGCSSCIVRSARLVSEREGFLHFVRRLYRSSDLQGQLDPPGDEGGLNSSAGPAFSEPLAPGYRFVRRIHRGGQGIVYEAIQESTRRRVAVKLVDLPESGVSSRFEREVQILAQLRHPHIVAIHDSGRSEHDAWFVMDYIEGRRLNEYFPDPKSKIESGMIQTQLERILKLFRTIAGAVSAAHFLGIVHRDLKPANILVDGAGQPQILDFGLARMTEDISGTSTQLTVTQSGQFLGTPAWASPEQAEGAATDARTDVYSLGVMLYQAITGKTPYPVEVGSKELLNNICHRIPERPSRLRGGLGSEIDAIVLKCLAKEPARRYQNAGELADDLDHYLNGRPVAAKGDGAFYALRKSVGRHKAMAAVSMLALSCVVALAIMMTISSIRLQRERDALRELDQERQQNQKKDEDLRQTSYHQLVGLAQLAYDTHHSSMSKSYLDRCPLDLRGWEWERQNYLIGSGLTDIDYSAMVHPETPFWGLNRSGRSDGGFPIVSRSSHRYVCKEQENIAIRSFPDRKLLALIKDPKVSWMTFSPEGDELAWIHSEYRCLRIASLKGSLENLQPVTHDLPFTCWSCEYSNDGTMIALTDGTTNSVAIWDRASRQVIKRFGILAHNPVCAHFSPDSSLLAVGTFDPEIHVFDVKKGVEVKLFTGQGGGVSCMAWSPNGKTLVSGGFKDPTCVWEVESGRCLRMLQGHEMAIHCVAFHEDGNQVLTIQSTSKGLIWNLSKQQDVITWGRPNIARYGAGNFSPDGKLFVLAGPSGLITTFDVAANDQSASWQTPDYRLHVALFSPDGKWILSAGNDYNAYLWDARTHEKVRTLKGNWAGIPSACFSPDSKRVLTGGWDHTCRVWDIASGRRELSVEANDQIWDSEFMRDGKSFIGGGKDGFLTIWSAEDGRQLWTKQAHSAEVDAIAVSPDGRYFATGGWDGRLLIWNASTYEPLHDKKLYGQHAYSAVFTADSRRVLIGEEEMIEVFDVISGERVYAFRAHGASIYSLAFPRNSNLLCSCGGDGVLKFWPTLKASSSLK